MYATARALFVSPRPQKMVVDVGEFSWSSFLEYCSCLAPGPWARGRLPANPPLCPAHALRRPSCLPLRPAGKYLLRRIVGEI